MKSNQGFTLIEVLIALLILAIALTALLTTTSQTIINSSRIKDKTIKHWLEIKTINKIKMQSITILSGTKTTIQSRAFGKTWYLQAKLSPTAIKHVSIITLRISDKKFGPFQDPIDAFYYEKQ
jgi:general secretion pathway protein I